MRKVLLLLFSCAMLGACKPKMEPINFGHDDCDYCKMTIMDTRYAAELVTSKGKVYKFDAIECIINYSEEHSDTHFALTLVSTIDQQALKPAADCTYLRSHQLPSPMGKFITGVSDMETGKKYQQDFGGQLFTWQELYESFENLPSVLQ